MTIEMGTEATSRGIKNGSLPRMMESTLKDLHAEAAYFTTHEGHRTAYIVFDLQEPSQMPPIAEPFFAEMDAKIEWSPVMNAEDLQEGLRRLSQK